MSPPPSTSLAWLALRLEYAHVRAQLAALTTPAAPAPTVPPPRPPPRLPQHPAPVVTWGRSPAELAVLLAARTACVEAFMSGDVDAYAAACAALRTALGPRRAGKPTAPRTRAPRSWSARPLGAVILTELRAAGAPLSAPTLRTAAAAHGYARNSVQPFLTHMVREGSVRRCDRGLYGLP